jgi:hypothetical protein
VRGDDHPRLGYLYKVLLDCHLAVSKTLDPLAVALVAESERKAARLLKCCHIASKLPRIAQGMDLKRLLGEGGEGGGGALAEVRLHVSLANVHPLAKLVKDLPPPPSPASKVTSVCVCVC